MMEAFRRIVKWGLKNFWRNGWLSTATVSIMILTLLVITVLLMVNVVANAVLENLENKIDISVYFKLQTPEEDILAAKTQLEKLVEVERIDYTSQNQALLNFREKHKDNPVLLQSLDELETNPLEASLNIKAKETSQYVSINQFLESVHYKDIIDKVNYMQNKGVIEKLSKIITDVKTVGLTVSLLLAVIVFLVTFNAIRLAIYSSREEINVMKLVGASNWFIRGPFIVEGLMYGVLATIITVIFLYPAFYFASSKLSGFLPIDDLFSYFKTNLFSLFFLLLGVGLVLGVFSSFIAVRKYLKD
ncbi:ABC transporter permease [Patescibacteria group bacterium]|nr:ABC transporter permease [Patescibacteria group bacterium]MBU4458468.1 ABC transporter permease [Patescibacteria group bacterium]MCG2696321.1 ABC transporter permease [Candidatus Portnoybacteria bacterium]